MSIAAFAGPAAHASVASSDVPLWRLYLLRSGYLLLVVGLGMQVWPAMLHHAPWELMQGVVNSILAAVSLLAILGLRYPLKMLPLLMFEMVWKSIWLLTVALPLWRADRIDTGTAATIFACLIGVIFPIIIPWRHVLARYAGEPGDRWR